MILKQHTLSVKCLFSSSDTLSVSSYYSFCVMFSIRYFTFTLDLFLIVPPVEESMSIWVLPYSHFVKYCTCDILLRSCNEYLLSINLNLSHASEKYLTYFCSKLVMSSILSTNFLIGYNLSKHFPSISSQLLMVALKKNLVHLYCTMLVWM